MNISIEILGPVVALIAWSLFMWVWMYATRIPAMLAIKMKPDSHAPRGEQMALLPANVRWKADNYNHLMEQPTIFYALSLTLTLLPVDAQLCTMIAWSYVAIRVAHSLVQALVNKIEIRFLLFVISNIPLFALTWLASAALINA